MVLQERYRASERLVCRVVGQHRSTQRDSAQAVSIDEGKLRHGLCEVATEYIRSKCCNSLKTNNWICQLLSLLETLPHRAVILVIFEMSLFSFNGTHLPRWHLNC